MDEAYGYFSIMQKEVTYSDESLERLVEETTISFEPCEENIDVWESYLGELDEVKVDQMIN